VEQVIEGTDNVYRLAKKYHLKTAFGTDILFSAREVEQQGNRLAALTRWYTPTEALNTKAAPVGLRAFSAVG
jgi:imidazolonepropionase-like amidohydrolase